MSTRFRILLTAALLLVSSGLALAQEAPKWSYIEAGYIDFDPDGGVSDDGWFAGGVFELGDMFHVLAEYDDVGDFTFWNLGFGWHGGLRENADLFAQALWNDVDFDSDTGDASDEGFEVDAGIRWMLLDRLELNGQVNYLSFDEADDDTTFQFGGIFFLMENRLGIGASWETGDSDTLRAFGRWNFGG
jgi:hypothetical protein